MQVDVDPTALVVVCPIGELREIVGKGTGHGSRRALKNAGVGALPSHMADDVLVGAASRFCPNAPRYSSSMGPTLECEFAAYRLALGQFHHGPDGF